MTEAGSLKNPGKMNVSKRIKTLYSGMIFVGLVVFFLAMMQDQERAWHAYLVGYFYFVTLALGGLFFTAVQHMTKAGWSVNIRRFSECLMAFLVPALFLGIPLFVFGMHDLYEWSHPEAVAHDALLQHKASYLNPTFFYIRYVLFFVVWLWVGKTLIKYSVAQDESKDESLTHKSVPLSIAGVLLFALTYSLFSVDSLMSLEPHWFSTIFGVYAFAGLFQSTMAVMILLILYFMKNGQLKGYVDENHLHDLGKFMFAFTVFWAYIAFSQYMLIWYANLPEETIFFFPRSSGTWMQISISLILFKFIVPFFALLPRWAKRTPAHLIAVSILLLVMQFVDIYWLVYPSLDAEQVLLSWQEIGIFAGFAGLFIWKITDFLSKNNIVPIGDPRIQESLHHHVVY